MPLRCRFQTDGEARRQARHERALLVRLAASVALAFRVRGWQYRVAAGQSFLLSRPLSLRPSLARNVPIGYGNIVTAHAPDSGSAAALPRNGLIPK